MGYWLNYVNPFISECTFIKSSLLLKKIFYTVLAVLSCSNYLFAQHIPDLILSQITEENGLSDNHVQCVLKDSKGFVWIGTADGLNRMDGSTIKIFKHKDNDSTSLSYDNIFSLAEDTTGNIWIATGNKGLCCYLRDKKIFQSIGIPFSPYGPSNIIHSVVVDAGQNIWCGTNGGLYVYTPSQKTFRPFLNEMAGEDKRQVNDIYQMIRAKDEQLWIGTGDGLWSFNIQQHIFKRQSSKQNDPTYEGLTAAVYEDRGGRMWFGNWSNGLKELDKKTGKVIDYLGTGPTGGNSNVVAINEIEQPDGKTVLFLNGQLQGFSIEDHRFFNYTKPSFMTGYPGIIHIDRSADSWLWICSDKGLLVYNPQRQLFQHHFTNTPLTSQGVNFFEWNGLLMVGGENDNFLKAYDDQWNLQKDHSRILNGASNELNKWHASMLSVAKENEEISWIGNSAGILKLNLRNDQQRWFRHTEGDSSSIPRNFVNHLFFDSQKRLWVFPWREGIWLMDTTTGKCKRIWEGFSMELDKIKKLVIADATEDAAGNIWMTDLDEGIILFEKNTGKFSKPFEKIFGPRYRCQSIFYHDNYCYSFTDGEILKWNTVSRELQQFPLPPEMNKYINDMVPDADNNFWLATNSGLVCFLEKNNSFSRFTTADGLYANDLDGKLYLKNNGDIIFGQINYLTVFTPSKLLSSASNSPTLVVTGISANGNIKDWDSTKTIQLNYRENNLIFNWAVQDYINPFRNQYYCKLEGIDADWRYLGNTGEVQYANLNAGDYHLLLKGATANGVAAGKVISIHFIITPPFWKTTWFWIIVLLIILVMLFLLVRKRINGIKRKAALQQQMSELEMKALRAQMNPHFIFNSLSSIQESIISNKTEAASKSLGKFSKLIRIVLENSSKKFISLHDEINYLQLYLELESFRFDDLNFTISCNESDTAFIRIPPMIVQPYVENALKHGLAHKAGEKKLSVLFYHNEKNQLIAEITDNGIGRKQSTLINTSRTDAHQSMGMQITQQRLSLLNEEQQASVEITDLSEENGSAAGTKVTVILPTEQ